MAVSRLLPQGGANDFNIAIGGQYTSVIFDKEYSPGAYTITSAVGDTTFDIYAYNSNGSLAGYTKTPSLITTIGFIKIVILGGTPSDLLSFAYKTTYTSVDDSDETLAGPVATSISPTSAPKINDTFTLTGRNFASNCTVTFTSANTAYPATQAKNIVRSSATSLIVTRPDNLIQDYSPYTITVQNPGVSNPTGSNSHILANALTAGADPVWVTGSVLSYITGTSTSFTLSATDADAGSSITYSIVSGTLPTGLSFNAGTATISGTPTTSQQTVTFRATDSGGNITDKAIKFNAGPTWVTGTALPSFTDSAYSTQLVIADDLSTAGAVFTLSSGTLPSGFTLSSGGLISGTTTSTSTSTFTVTATDSEGGVSATRTFTLGPVPPGGTFYSTPGTYSWTAPAGVTRVSVVAVGGGGGGAAANTGNAGAGGGLGWKNNITVVPGQSYTVVVGDGGFGPTTPPTRGSNGGQSYFINTSTVAGNGGQGGSLGDGANDYTPQGGGYVGDGGGNGGNGGYENVNTSGPGGGGAGGYTGNGGAGASSVTSYDGNRSGYPGSGGGGGGGSAGGDTTGLQGGGGGGVGVYGAGASGGGGAGAGATSSYGGRGGGGGSGGTSGGTSTDARYFPAGDGGLRGGGGGGTNDAGSGTVKGGLGGVGAVRIIWGLNRSFPSTNVSQNFGGVSETVI